MSFDDVSLNPSALRASERSQVSAGIARLNRRQLHGGEAWRSHQNCAGTERAKQPLEVRASAAISLPTVAESTRPGFPNYLVL
jgi:hypothetical protein